MQSGVRGHTRGLRQRAKELLQLTRGIGKQSVSMRRKLFAHWMSLLLVMFSVLFAVLSLLGVFSESQSRLHGVVSAQHERTASALTGQASLLTAQGIMISQQASLALENLLLTEPVSALNNDPGRLEELERAFFSIVNTALRSSPCNGAFIVVEATANTQTADAETSRAGVYLRFANLNAKDAVSQDVTLYRGIPSVARGHQLELHNRWRMEFNTVLIPGYAELLAQPAARLAEVCYWTDRGVLTDTWEQPVWLIVPVYDVNGATVGACGVELSDLFMRLSYPAQHGEFGSMVTVVAPLRNGALDLARGMVGEPNGTYLSDTDTLRVAEGDLFNTYTGSSGTFLGLQSRIDMATQSGDPMYAVTLVPKAYYDEAVLDRRVTLVAGALVLLFTSLALSMYLSKRFVRPISDLLETIKNGEPGETEQTGISEIDALVGILDSKTSLTEQEVLSPDVAELLDDFAQRFATLTPTEQGVARLYAEGREVNEVAELAFVSIHTVRKHNANIYRKLNVSSREELVLFLEIFRRSGRLDDLFAGQSSQD